MAKFSIFISVVLIAIGLVAYNGTDKELVSDMDYFKKPPVSTDDQGEEKKSMTAMIPAFVGFPILILGTLALMPAARKHSMHLVAVIALLGAGAGLGRGLMKWSDFMAAADYGSRRPVLFSLIMGGLCLVLLIGCIGSFMAAKRKRLAEADSN